MIFILAVNRFAIAIRVPTDVLVIVVRRTEAEGIFMQIGTKEIIPAPLRNLASFMLYAFVGVQYIVLLKIIYDMRQQHSLPFRVWLLPILYLGPLGIGFSFRQFMKLLLRNASMTSEAALVCNDWLTFLLITVYGILLNFRLLN